MSSRGYFTYTYGLRTHDTMSAAIRLSSGDVRNNREILQLARILQLSCISCHQSIAKHRAAAACVSFALYTTSYIIEDSMSWQLMRGWNDCRTDRTARPRPKLADS